MTAGTPGTGKTRDGDRVRHRVSVVVPVFNEAATVEQALERLVCVPFDKEVIVVDDGSEDGTDAILERILKRGWIDLLLKHETNRGKGAAMRTAFKHVGGSVVVVLDADLELDPADIPRLLAPIEEGGAVAVYGTRDIRLRKGMMLRQYLGNKLITFVTNLCTNLRLTDVETCYKMVRTDLLRTLELVSDRFTIDPEITIRLAQTGVPIHEVPISYRPRSHAEGKKITWKDGVAALWSIVRFTLFGPKPARWDQTGTSERRPSPAGTAV
ncbi:MAG: glycosyltransferase family 2 protein [Gemmatimonadetes bacterium]|nr:glycosyltransferase family 2 protein [Gemmatimonadota bacterium]MYA63643.1 glycosyltransferase family 2 protein [Gemmatimonadota bacterium]MYB98141.1 glycosyltransferase family 2 protein [Gemmatimonadota bacterium]MYH53321.1 glycosyltransferase family 2 protein [Gemmatimonadota bacterium]MYI46026.1 glycosyltransferase family 2 protein [Gemmatimonadota bacterium]